MDELIGITEMISSLCIWGYIAGINLITFVLFAIDKFKAMAGAWRISEKLLLTCSLAGGAVGGWISMQIFRHKTKTPVFKYGLPVMILLHIAFVNKFLFI